MTMRLISPRRTAPYHTLDSSPRITSPSTVAPGTTQALEWMVGPFCSRGTIPSWPVGIESGSICIGEADQDGTRIARSQGYERAGFTEAVIMYYKIVINVLLRKRRSTLIGRMASKITLVLGTALAAIAFGCFVESSFSQDALVASLDATENDDRDGDDKDDKDEKSRSSRTRTSSSVVSRFLT